MQEAAALTPPGPSAGQQEPRVRPSASLHPRPSVCHPCRVGTLRSLKTSENGRMGLGTWGAAVPAHGDVAA